VTELVTNAIVHAHTLIDPQITVGTHRVRVEVRDGSSYRPTPHRGADPVDGERTNVSAGRVVFTAMMRAVGDGSALDGAAGQGDR